MWFNSELESRNFIIPGLIAVIMTVIASLLTSLTVAREWERGTMEQLLSTPIAPMELIVGKLAPLLRHRDSGRPPFACDDIFPVWGKAQGERASPRDPLLIFLVVVLGMGLPISIRTRNQLLANQLAVVLTFLPPFLLSGFVWAISNMPKVVQVVTYPVPARYFITIIKGIYMKGVGLVEVGFAVVILIVIGLLILFAARLSFKGVME